MRFSWIHHEARHGFTLIELMIVFAMISILATLAIQSFVQYEKSAHDIAAKDSVKHAYTAAVAYMTAKGKSWSQACADTLVLVEGGWRPTSGITTSANGTTILATPGDAGNYSFAIDSTGHISRGSP